MKYQNSKQESSLKYKSAQEHYEDWSHSKYFYTQMETCL